MADNRFITKDNLDNYSQGVNEALTKAKEYINQKNQETANLILSLEEKVDSQKSDLDGRLDDQQEILSSQDGRINKNTDNIGTRTVIANEDPLITHTLWADLQKVEKIVADQQALISELEANKIKIKTWKGLGSIGVGDVETGDVLGKPDSNANTPGLIYGQISLTQFSPTRAILGISVHVGTKEETDKNKDNFNALNLNYIKKIIESAAQDKIEISWLEEYQTSRCCIPILTYSEPTVSITVPSTKVTGTSENITVNHTVQNTSYDAVINFEGADIGTSSSQIIQVPIPSMTGMDLTGINLGMGAYLQKDAANSNFISIGIGRYCYHNGQWVLGAWSHYALRNCRFYIEFVVGVEEKTES